MPWKVQMIAFYKTLYEYNVSYVSESMKIQTSAQKGLFIRILSSRTNLFVYTRSKWPFPPFYFAKCASNNSHWCHCCIQHSDKKVRVILSPGFHVSVILVQLYPDLIVLHQRLLGARYAVKWGRTRAKVLPDDNHVTVITAVLPAG